MKNLLFTAFLSAIVLQAFAQQHDFSCPMDGPGNASILNQLDNVQFFSKTTCATPLYLNCNFVFLTRDDGTGTFPPNDPFTLNVIDEIVKRMNDRWERVEDTDNCSPGESYPYDSNIRVNVNTHYVANTDAWDYYAQAQQMTDYSFADFCPAAIDNNNSSTWPELKKVIDEFNMQYPDAINFFFVENGGHLAYLEDAVNNNETIAAPWNDNIPIFSGCSRLAAPHDSEQDQFIIMANFYTEYYARVNFGGIYSPEFSHIPNETIAQWHLDGVPITANHELVRLDRIN